MAYLVKSRNYQCFICNTETVKDIDKPSGTSSSSVVISKHLNVIFILRKILELPVNKLVSWLKIFPDDWVKRIEVCDRCSELVTECKNIYRDLMTISRKLKSSQLKVIKVIKESSCVKSEKYDPKSRNSANFDFIKETRNFVNEHNYEDGITTDHFLEGDLKAYQKLRDQAPVKKEVEESPVREEDGVGTLEWEENCEESDEDREYNGIPKFSDPESDADSFKPKLKKARSSKTDKLSTSGPFKCDMCDKGFTRNNTVKLHKFKVHGIAPPSKVKSFSCSICLKKFSVQATLQRHQRNLHPDHTPTDTRKSSERHCCQVCSKSYRDHSSLKQHLLEKHPEKVTFPCPHCPSLQFPTRRLLTHHIYETHKKDKKTLSFMSRVQNAKRVPDDNLNEACVFCGVIFKSWDLLRRHLDKHETSISEDKRPLKCYFCWKSYSQEQSIWAHLHSSRLHDYTKLEFCCDHSDHMGFTEWAFKSPSILETHFNGGHPDETIFKCSDCQWPFLDKNMLDLHRLGHLPRVNQKYQCPACDNFFLHADSLRNHFNTTHGANLKLYRCQICRWGFPIKNGLSMHMRSQHNDDKLDETDKQFKCSECPKYYKTAIQLRDHKRTIHVMKQCQLCGIVIRKGKFSRHMVTQHGDGGEGRHLCMVCGKVYKEAGGLKKHMSSHGVYHYSCQFCGKGYATGALLRRHVQRLHAAEGGNKQ